MGEVGRHSSIAAAAAVLASAMFVGAAQAHAAGVNLLEDATGIPAALQKAVGGKVIVYTLTLYDDNATVDVQEADHKENIDRYKYRDGAFGKAAPVTMHGRYTQKDLDAAIFPLESIDFSLVPKMIADARQQLAMPDGKAGGLTLKSGRPYRQPHWSVLVSDARHTGAVDYDLKGRKLGTFKK
jgi:hypothetical protein